MKGTYLVYDSDVRHEPLAAFELLTDAEKFARHCRHISYGVNNIRVEAVPYFEATGQGYTGPSVAWEVDDDGTDAPDPSALWPDEDGEACDGR